MKSDYIIISDNFKVRNLKSEIFYELALSIFDHITIFSNSDAEIKVNFD